MNPYWLLVAATGVVVGPLGLHRPHENVQDTLHSQHASGLGRVPLQPVTITAFSVVSCTNAPSWSFTWSTTGSTGNTDVEVRETTSATDDPSMGTTVTAFEDVPGGPGSQTKYFTVSDWSKINTSVPLYLWMRYDNTLGPETDWYPLDTNPIDATCSAL